MVRGRKRDVSAPLTRSLILQRDYRARRAKYVSNLETKCRELEEENARLLKEVEDLRGQIHQRDESRIQALASLTTEAEGRKAHALSEVLNSLSSAVTSIQSFQKITLGPHFTHQQNDPDNMMFAPKPKPSWSISLSHTPPMTTTATTTLRPPSEPPSSSSSRLMDVNHATGLENEESSSLNEQGGGGGGGGGGGDVPMQLYSPVSNGGAGSRRSRSRSHSNATELESHDYDYWETTPTSGGSNCDHGSGSGSGSIDNRHGPSRRISMTVPQSEDSNGGLNSRHCSSQTRVLANSSSVHTSRGSGPSSGVEHPHPHLHTHPNPHPHTLQTHYHREPLMMDYANDTSPQSTSVTLPESLPENIPSSSSGMIPMGITSGFGNANTRGSGGCGIPTFNPTQTYATSISVPPPPSHHQPQPQPPQSTVFDQDISDTTPFERMVSSSHNHSDLRTWN